MHKIRRGDAPDPADVSAPARARVGPIVLPRANERHIAALVLRPERRAHRGIGELHRIVCLGDDGALLQPTPANAVRRNERHQPATRAVPSHVKQSAERLEALARGNAGTPIEKRREVVRNRSGRVVENHIITAAPTHFEQPEIRLPPLNSVGRLGVAGHLIVPAVRRRAGFAAIIQPVNRPVLDDGDVSGKFPVPRRIEGQHRPHVHRRAQAQFDALHLVHQVTIDEEFQSPTERHGFRRGMRRRRCSFAEHKVRAEK